MERAITGCAHARCPEGDHFWASLDGESWHEVTRLPEDTEADRAAVAELFADRRGWRPMSYARRWLLAQPGLRFV